MKITVQEVNFTEVLPYWENYLWPQRQSKIEDVSVIDHFGRLTLDRRQLKAQFYAALDFKKRIVGVNSGLKTSPVHFRSRGIWVHPEFRFKGVGSLLLEAISTAAQTQKCTIVWSMPRLGSVQFYESCGFRFNHTIPGFEYGPHALMTKALAKLTSAGVCL